MGFLNAEELQDLEITYTEMAEKLQQKYPQEVFPSITEYVSVEPNAFEKSFEKYKDIKVSQEEYVKLFQDVIDLLGLPHKVVVSDQVSSIFDGDRELKIPNSKAYEKLRLERVLELISHEITSHYVNQYNGEQFFHGVRTWKNVEKEE